MLKAFCKLKNPKSAQSSQGYDAMGIPVIVLLCGGKDYRSNTKLMYKKNRVPRKGQGSSAYPVKLSASSNSSTNKLIRAVRRKKFTTVAELLEESGIVGEVALFYIGVLDLSLRGVK